MSLQLDTSPEVTITGTVTEQQRNTFKSRCSMDGQSIKQAISDFVRVVNKHGLMAVQNHIRLLDEPVAKKEVKV